MSIVQPSPERVTRPPLYLPVDLFGQLVPVSRQGGQGRVYRPEYVPRMFGPSSVVVKLYREPPPAESARVLADMVSWSRRLELEQAARLQLLTAWPLTIVSAGPVAVGIAMRDVSSRFGVPFEMPSGRREDVLLSLEHLLGHDAYLKTRGLEVSLTTTMRVRIAERISAALAFLHRHAIAVSDISPNNLLVRFDSTGPEVCFIDCDSMVFHGRQALPSVETSDWHMPAEFAELARSRAADSYKLGLLVLRLLTRSHDARTLGAHRAHVPPQVRPLLARALGANAANRPPAGEWQRTLRGLLDAGGLNERYPGPAPKARPSARPRGGPRRPADAPTRPPRAHPARTHPGRTHPGRTHPQAGYGSRNGARAGSGVGASRSGRSGRQPGRVSVPPGLTMAAIVLAAVVFTLIIGGLFVHTLAARQTSVPPSGLHSAAGAGHLYESTSAGGSAAGAGASGSAGPPGDRQP